MMFKKVLHGRYIAWTFLFLPILLAGIYFSALAQDRYVSRTAVSVRDISGGVASGGSSALSSLLGSGSGVGAVVDLLSLKTYIHSAEMLKRLDQRLQLREHYSTPVFDFYYRLSKDAPNEKFLRYFNDRVEITYDDTTGVLVVEAQAFDREIAKKISSAVLEESEAFLNEYMHRIARDKMSFAQIQIEQNEKLLKDAKSNLLQFQVRNKLLDPISQSSANNALTANLQAALATQESALNASLAYLSEDSYQVKTLRGQLAATKAQLDAERLRATASTGGTQLAALTIEFQSLVAKAAFAEENYKAALLSFELARNESLRKLKALVVLEPPTLPDLAIYPRRLYDFLTCVVGFLMMFTVIKLLIATVREHQD